MTAKPRPYLASIKKDLQQFRGEWPEIARKAQVSYTWIVHLMSGRTKNPRVRECERVRKVLDKKLITRG